MVWKLNYTILKYTHFSREKMRLLVLWSMNISSTSKLGGAMGWMKLNPPMLPLSLSNSPVGGTHLGPCSKHHGKVDSFQFCWQKLPKSLFFPYRVPQCHPPWVIVGRKAPREGFKGNQISHWFRKSQLQLSPFWVTHWSENPIKTGQFCLLCSSYPHS